MTLSWVSHGESELPAELDWLAAGERERVARMRFAKRRNDYLIGRWTAKSAVARMLGFGLDARELARVEVRHAPGGAPELFVDDARAPLEISISDRAGWGVCALRAGRLAIGCDLELVEPRSPAFVADYLTPSERLEVEREELEEERHRLANLIWSAKESALKVLRTGLRRDTRSVEVTLGPDRAAEGWSPLRVRGDGRTFPGWWRRYGPFLLTFAAEVDVPPPVALLEPPGLASGLPSHSWLAAPRGP